MDNVGPRQNRESPIVSLGSSFGSQEPDHLSSSRSLSASHPTDEVDSLEHNHTISSSLKQPPSPRHAGRIVVGAANLPKSHHSQHNNCKSRKYEGRRIVVEPPVCDGLASFGPSAITNVMYFLSWLSVGIPWLSPFTPRQLQNLQTPCIRRQSSILISTRCIYGRM